MKTKKKTAAAVRNQLLRTLSKTIKQIDADIPDQDTATVTNNLRCCADTLEKLDRLYDEDRFS